MKDDLNFSHNGGGVSYLLQSDFLRGQFTLYTSSIQSRHKNATLDVGQHYTNSSSLAMICTNILMNPILKITNRATANFSGLPTFDLWFLGCIIFHCLFGPPLCNFDCQQINSLLLFLYTIDSISLKCLCFHFNISQESSENMRILENKD